MIPDGRQSWDNLTTYNPGSAVSSFMHRNGFGEEYMPLVFRDDAGMMMTSALGNDGQGGGGGYTFTGNAAASMFEYFANGGNINGLSFNNGWANWYTLDGQDSMYNNGSGMLQVSSADMIMHRAKLNDSSWGGIKNWTDWSATTMQGTFKHIESQRTNFYNSGHLVDNLGTVRSTAYAGRAVDSQIGLRSTYVKTTAMYGKYAKRVGAVGHMINAGQIGYGIYEDGWSYGKNAKVATVGVAGGMAGAAAGAWALGKVLGAVGTLVGPEGTIIGAAIGGIVGGIVGGVWGGDIAESWANSVIE